MAMVMVLLSALCQCARIGETKWAIASMTREAAARLERRTAEEPRLGGCPPPVLCSAIDSRLCLLPFSPLQLRMTPEQRDR